MAEFTTPEDFEKYMASMEEQYRAGYITAKQYNEAQKDATAGIKGYTATLNQSLGALGTSLNALTKDMYSGTQGVGHYGNMLESGADVVAKYTEKFGPAGVALGMMTKAAAAYAAAALKQSDSLFDAYGRMNKVGTVGATAMSETFAQMRQYGYNIEQLGNFTDLLARNSKNFGTFSKSALDGARQFGKVSNSIQNSPLRQQFFRLGMTVDDINDGIAGYMFQQGKLGKLQGMTGDQLRDGTVKYLTQLDSLTKLTGMTRQEQEDAREQALQVESFYAGLADLKPEAAEQALQAYTQALAKGGPKVAAEMAANFNGVITGSSDLMLSTGGQSMKYFSKEFFARGGTADQAMAGVAGSISPTMTEVTKNLNQLGGAFGLNLRTINQLKGGVDPLAETMNNLSAKTRAQMGGLDKTTAAQAKARDLELKQARNMQSFVQAGVEPATRALAKFTEITEDLIDKVGPGSEGRVKARKAQREAEKKQQAEVEKQQQAVPLPSPQQTPGGKGKRSGAREETSRAEETAPVAATDVDKILATIRYRESRGQYTKENTDIDPKTGKRVSTASGAYQFIDSTWQAKTKQAKLGTEYARAKDAPKEIQDAIARLYVETLLKQAGGDVSKIPLAWYTGNIQGKISADALAANKGMTPETYQSKWMTDYGKMSRPNASTNVATLSGPTAKYTAMADTVTSNLTTQQRQDQSVSQTSSMQEQNALLLAQVDQMSEVIRLLKTQNSTSTKILQSTQ